MTAIQLLQDLSWLLYVLIFVSVVLRLLRLPTQAHVDMVLFFGDTTLIIVLGTFQAVGAFVPSVWLSVLTGALLMLLPYLLLRLVRDFSRVPSWLVRATELGAAVSVLAILVLPTPMPALPALVLVAYFLAVTSFDTWAFVHGARRTSGVTRRRMQSIAVGTLCVGLVLLVAGVTAARPDTTDLWTPVSQVLGLASGIAYFLGFAPPTWLRRAWQEPELRAFLSRAASLPHLPDTPSILQALEVAAAAALGAPAATIGLWSPATGRLRFLYHAPPQPEPEHGEPSASFALHAGLWEVDPGVHPISGRAFLEQRAFLITNVEREDPVNVSIYRSYRARSALTAPISAGDHRLGVLMVYAPSSPIFASSDLELLRILADQAAVILESRALIDSTAQLQAREEAMRLKEDFLSSAAHDLKTPLTGILTQTQILQLKAHRDPLAPADAPGLDRLQREARRLKSVILELLDAAQLDGTSAGLDVQEVDIVRLARELCLERHRCRVEAVEALPGAFDVLRVRQMLEHLIDNALTYDPSGAEVVVRFSRQGDRVRLTVTDRGIGIPQEDLPHIFERFHRGRNVDDRRFAGLGLGLYISQRIVDQHGGRIWVESILGQGTTFFIDLPLLPVDDLVDEQSRQRVSSLG